MRNGTRGCSFHLGKMSRRTQTPRVMTSLEMNGMNTARNEERCVQWASTQSSTHTQPTNPMDECIFDEKWRRRCKWSRPGDNEVPTQRRAKKSVRMEASTPSLHWSEETNSFCNESVETTLQETTLPPKHPWKSGFWQVLAHTSSMRRGNEQAEAALTLWSKGTPLCPMMDTEQSSSRKEAQTGTKIFPWALFPLCRKKVPRRYFWKKKEGEKRKEEWMEQTFPK